MQEDAWAREGGRGESGSAVQRGCLDRGDIASKLGYVGQE